MRELLQALAVQRWDDHRYYHQSRINQSLHFISAISFLCGYYLLFTNPSAAALVGWLIAMLTRQSGHFFFEPKGFDHVNNATHDYKEDIKVGYNLKRKVVLMAIWGLSPLLLYATPTLFGTVQPYVGPVGFAHHVGLIWLAIGIGALLFRMFHLFILQDVQTGLIWVAKILTDPFHDIMLYWKSPFYLLRGELLDPMDDRRPLEETEQHA